MNKNTFIVVGIVVIVLIAGGIYALTRNGVYDAMTNDKKIDGTTMIEANDDVTVQDETNTTDKKDAMMKTGSYESYGPEKLALAESGKVVLFFRASWCPTCRTLDASIRSNLGAIPEGVVILDVDYDNSTALKQKYGVTYQHTLVQVDALGGQITKWVGSLTLADLVSQIK